MHSVVRIEPAKLILVGTRITYQATGDAGSTWYQLQLLIIRQHSNSCTYEICKYEI